MKATESQDSVSSDPWVERVEQAKAGSVGQVLMRCGRLFNELALAQVRQAGMPGIRNAHTALFPHIDWSGTRLVDLAKRVGVSKQAVGQWVDELQDMGMFERRPDPNDGRAKLIALSEQGRAGVLRGIQVLDQLRDDLKDEVGEARLERLHEDLRVLCAVLEARHTREAKLEASSEQTAGDR